MMVKQKFSFLALCVLALIIVIEAKPWCGLNGCDSSEQNEKGGSDLSNEDNSSESNENEPDQTSYTPDNQDKRYGQSKNFQIVNGPGGQGINGLGRYIPDEYVPGQHDQGLNGLGRHVTGGYGQGINGLDGYVPGGYIPSGYVPVGYVPTRYIPSEYIRSEYVPGGYIPSRYVPSGYVPIGYIPGEYFPVYNLGRHGQGRYASGFSPSNPNLDIYLRNFNNGDGIREATGNEMGGHVSGGPCGIGGNLPCDGRQPSYPYNNDKRIDNIY